VTCEKLDESIRLRHDTDTCGQQLYPSNRVIVGRPTVQRRPAVNDVMPFVNEVQETGCKLIVDPASLPQVLDVQPVGIR